MEPLAGERDCNFKAVTDSGTFVLKFANPAEALGRLEMQQAALRHVARWDPELPLPKPVATSEGPLVGTATVAGVTVGVSLRSFLPGDLVDDVSPVPGLVAEINRTLAKLDLALRTFRHPELRRPLPWDLQRLLELRPLLEYLDARQRPLVSSWLNRFETALLPAMRSRTAQPIHNDFNPANLVVDPAAPHRLAGILDLGDMTWGPRVIDLAVAAAYQCLGADEPASAIVAAAESFEEVLLLGVDDRVLLPDLVATRLVQSLLVSAWRAELHPDNRDYILIHSGPVWEALQRLLASDLDALRNRLAPAKGPHPTTTEEALQLRQTHISRGMRLSYDVPLHAESAETVWITDSTDVRYLDAYNNVAHVGHNHPEVTTALAFQAGRLNTNTRYLVDNVNEYASRLADLLPPPLDVVFFANSGSEANDLAFRIARIVTGRRGLIVTEHAYHGSTYLTMAASPEELGHHSLEPWVATIPPPPAAPAADLSAAIGQLEATANGVAAFVCDPMFSSDGIHVPARSYLVDGYAAVRAAGGLCIADEVQAGLGRVGSELWGFAGSSVVPDIVTLGKPLGNGHPLAAVVTTRRIADEFADRGYYFSTFAGNPVSAAVGSAVLDVMERERLPRQAEVVGEYLTTLLTALAATADEISDVRGRGLFIGVEIATAEGAVAPERAAELQNRMKRDGVLIGRTGRHGNVLKIRPPLVFAERHADLLVERLAALVHG